MIEIALQKFFRIPHVSIKYILDDRNFFDSQNICIYVCCNDWVNPLLWGEIKNKTKRSTDAVSLCLLCLFIVRKHNSTEHPKLISIPYIYPIGQDIAIEIGYPISIQKYV